MGESNFSNYLMDTMCQIKPQDVSCVRGCFTAGAHDQEPRGLFGEVEGAPRPDSAQVERRDGHGHVERAGYTRAGHLDLIR